MSKLKNLIETIVKRELNELRIHNSTDLKFMNDIVSVLNRSPFYAEFDKKRGNIKVYKRKGDTYYVNLNYRYRGDDYEF